MLVHTPQRSFASQRTKAISLVGLFVAAFLVILPLHLTGEHHHDWADAHAGNHACDNERPDSQPIDEVHTHAEHFWAALPNQLSGDAVVVAFAAILPEVIAVGFAPIARASFATADLKPPQRQILDLKRLRGPPLS